MPPSVSNLSLRKVGAIRLSDGDLLRAEHPVWIETRLVSGYFEALVLRDLCKEREDLSYIPKVVRNADRSGVPGFTFDQEGEETFNDYCKSLDREQAAAAAVKDEQSSATREERQS